MWSFVLNRKNHLARLFGGSYSPRRRHRSRARTKNKKKNDIWIIYTDTTGSHTQRAHKVHYLCRCACVCGYVKLVVYRKGIEQDRGGMDWRRADGKRRKAQKSGRKSIEKVAHSPREWSWLSMYCDCNVWKRGGRAVRVSGSIV